MVKYLIMMQQFDTPEECLGDYYLDMVNDIFHDKALAEKVMDEEIDAQIENSNKECDEEFYSFYRQGNNIYRKYHGDHAEIVTSYWVQEINIPRS